MLTAIIQAEGAGLDTNLYYAYFTSANGERISRTQSRLANIYQYKCGYCERYCHIPSIDHHRPKARVTGHQNNNHGYYWLVYEWTNLVPACRDCNSTSYKGAKYPINQARVTQPPLNGTHVIYTQLLYDSAHHRPEFPLILHPEYCDPDQHFDFTRQGRINGITVQGVASVTIYGLDRKDLDIERKDIYESYYKQLQRFVEKRFRPINPVSVAEFIDDLRHMFTEIVKAANNPKLNHTLFRKSLLKRIDYYFIEPFDVALSTPIKNALSQALSLI